MHSGGGEKGNTYYKVLPLKACKQSGVPFGAAVAASSIAYPIVRAIAEQHVNERARLVALRRPQTL